MYLFPVFKATKLEECHALQSKHLFLLSIYPASQQKPHNAKDKFMLKRIDQSVGRGYLAVEDLSQKTEWLNVTIMRTI